MTNQGTIQEILQRYSLDIEVQEPFFITPYSCFLAKHIHTYLGKSTPSTLVDFGCGCGIQSLIAAKLGVRKVYGVDIYEEAITLARKNAMTNNISQIKWINSTQNKDWASKFDCNIDFILSNPASLPSPDTLAATFWAGPDGMDMIRELIELSGKVLRPRGVLLFINTSLVCLRRTMNYLNDTGFDARIVQKEKLKFRDFYKPLIHHWEGLQKRKESFWLEEGEDRYEILNLIKAVKL